MNCVKCNATIYEGDKYCGNCGHPLDATVTQEKQSGNIYILEFLSKVFKSPSDAMISNSRFNNATYFAVSFAAILLAAIVSVLASPIYYYDFTEVINSFIRNLVIYLLVFGAYFIILVLNIMITKTQRPSVLSLFNSYSVVIVFTSIFFIMSSIFTMTNISYMPIFFNICALITLIVGSYYIINLHSQLTMRLDPLYGALIYIFLAGIVTYAIYHYWISSIFSQAFSNFNL